MRTALDQEQEELAADQSDLSGQPGQAPYREFTLSTTTLLVIFFGLVMVCGLFFGLGYTMGRGEPGAASPLLTTAAAAHGSGKSGGVAESTIKTASQPNLAQVAPDKPAPEPSSVPQPLAQPVSTASGAAGSQPVSPQAVAADAGTSTAATAEPGAIMVQIAAVSNQGDADVLLSALRKRGYSVSVRHEPGDSLMHVQVGPFANQTDAKAMRQKLLNDGYNAILR
jgi:cell division septation protein DedD